MKGTSGLQIIIKLTTAISAAASLIASFMLYQVPRTQTQGKALFAVSVIAALLLVLEYVFFGSTTKKYIAKTAAMINKTEKEFLPDSPKFTIQRLDFSEELRGENTRKTFYIDDPSDNEDQLVILSFGKERVVVNMALLEGNKISISKRPMPLKLDSLYAETETEYKDFRYTPNLKRPICIIDPETTEEIKPILYFDEKTNEVKGKCKLKPYKSYFAFEIREK